MRRIMALATTAVLFIAACSSDSDGNSDGDSGSSPAGPPPALTFADFDATTWKRGTDPERVVSAFGSIWVRYADGKVHRIDPDSGKVIATIPTGYSDFPACVRLTADDRYIWTCSSPNTMLRIDPRTNTADQPIRTSILSDQIYMPWSSGLLWTIRGSARTLDGWSADGSVAASVDLKAFCTDLAGSQTVVIALCPTDGKVVFVDPDSAKVVGSVPLEDPHRAAVADYAWVGYGDGTAQIDPETFEVVAEYDVVPTLEGSVWASDTDVWVRTDGGKPFLTHIDPAAHQIVETINAPNYESGGDVIERGDDLWATGYNDQLIVRMSAP